MLNEILRSKLPRSVLVISAIVLFCCGSDLKAQTIGDFDTDYGNDGWLELLEHKGKFSPRELIAQSDGSLLVTGQYNHGPGVSSFAAVKLLKEGVVDDKYGTGGYVITPIDSFQDAVVCAIGGADGSYYIGGSTEDAQGNTEWAIVKHLKDGTLDEDFGSKGILKGIYEGIREILTLKQLSDGSIMAMGAASDNLSFHLGLFRFSSNGVMDSSFGDDGKLSINLGDEGSFGLDFEVAKDGSVTIIGESTQFSNSDPIILRYTSDGIKDSGFGNDGRVLFTPQSDASFNDLHLNDDGSLTISAFAVSVEGDRDIAVVKFTKDGAPDETFGTDGMSMVRASENLDVARDLIVLPNDEILVVGYSWIWGASDIVLALFNSEGKLKSEFGDEGAILFDHYGSNTLVSHMIMNSNGEVYVLGNYFELQTGIPIIAKIVTGFEVSVMSAERPGAISVFPNPATNIIQIELAQLNAYSVSIKLVDLQGREVASSAGITSANGALSYQLPVGLDNGLYQLVVTSDKGIWSTPIIKE